MEEVAQAGDLSDWTCSERYRGDVQGVYGVGCGGHGSEFGPIETTGSLSDTLCCLFSGTNPAVGWTLVQNDIVSKDCSKDLPLH